MWQLAIASLMVVSMAVPARAELVFFATGRSLSVRGHQADGDSLVLTLRSGGVVVCDRSLISRIEPDEVPYPDPEEVLPSVVPAEVAVPYSDFIEKVAAEHGVDARLVKAVIQVESGYVERARSRKGAMGLMQLMPATAKEFGVINPFNPVENVRGGVAYLRRLLDRYDNNEQLALAAYNAGPNAVDRYGASIPPYRETQNYVSRVKLIAGPATRIPGTKIFKVVEIVNGRETVKYTDKAPK